MRGTIGIPVCLDSRAAARIARFRTLGSLAPAPDNETLKFASITTPVPAPAVTDAGHGINGKLVSPGAENAARQMVRRSSAALLVYGKQ
jgi:hypothetical protein